MDFASQFRTASELPSVNIGGAEIESSSSAKDLDVIIDNHLRMRKHICIICRSASYGIYKIGKLRKYLNQDWIERLVHAFVISRIDCNNSLLYGLPASDIGPLQRIQNAAARLVTGTRRHEHISPILKSLHWLPVYNRIIFKLLLLAYTTKHRLFPSISLNSFQITSPRLQCLFGHLHNVCWTLDHAQRQFIMVADLSR